MAAKLIDLTGRTFGRLKVIKRGENYSGGTVRWECLCDCGRRTTVAGGALKAGSTKSCGCLLKERAKETNTKHGLTGHPLYWAWSSMRSRCNNPSHSAYPHYGGRGIFVLRQWDDFEEFVKDMGPKPGPEYSLDRINNNGPYGPHNCRWATHEEQMRNTRRSRSCTNGH